MFVASKSLFTAPALVPEISHHHLSAFALGTPFLKRNLSVTESWAATVLPVKLRLCLSPVMTVVNPPESSTTTTWPLNLTWRLFTAKSESFRKVNHALVASTFPTWFSFFDANSVWLKVRKGRGDQGM